MEGVFLSHLEKKEKHTGRYLSTNLTNKGAIIGAWVRLRTTNQKSREALNYVAETEFSAKNTNQNTQFALNYFDFL